MAPPRWPRKNDAESIRARQDGLRAQTEDGEVFWDDLEPFANATEALTGVAVVPVAVVGPLRVALAEYELTEPQGRVEERSRAQEDVFVPLANTEGGLAISLHRGARAVMESGEFRTYVLRDRMTRASTFLFDSTGEAAEFARWVEGQAGEMQAWLETMPIEGLSRFARLREIETHVVGSMCHVMYAFTTGDAVGLNMVTRNSYALNQAYVPERAPVQPVRTMLEGNMGGDKKPSHRYFERGGHGKTVIAETTLTDDAIRRVLRTTPEDVLELAWIGTHGAVASGHAVRRLHAGHGDRGAVHRDRAGHRDGRDELDGPRRRAARRRRSQRVDPAAGPRGGDGRRRHDPPLRALVALAPRLRRPRQGLPLRADRGRGHARARDLRFGRDGDRGLTRVLQGPPRARRACARSL